MLLLDIFIGLAYLSSIMLSDKATFNRVLIIMVFFLAVRILALAIHPAISVVNVLMFGLLWRHNPSLLILLYLGYTLLYVYLYRKELFQERLEQENTKLLLETKSLQRYQLLHHRYEEQLELNLRLDERRRIAQQIHDLLGHTIAAAVLQLEASKSILKPQPDKAEAMVGQSIELLREGMNQIRATVRDMHSEIETIKYSSIELLVGKVRRDTGLNIILQPKGDLSRIPIGLWNVVYQVVNESLSNVVRHAGATQVTIEIQVLPRMLRLFISDNGVGFSTIKEGMGLQGMRERVEEVGGKMTLEGRDGMRLNCLIPLKGGDDDTTSHRGR